MTEAEWLAATDPQVLLNFLTISKRKLRLFASACCRLHASRRVGVLGEEWQSALIEACEIAELAADGLAELPPWRGVVNPKPADETAWSVHNPDVVSAVSSIVDNPACRKGDEVDFLRDIAGNPFRPIVPRSQPAGEYCVDPRALSIAQTIYDERTFEDMPILGDALEEAGCTSEEILYHCRGWKRCADCLEHPGECSYCLTGWVNDWWRRTPTATPPARVRGDWLVDLLLGYE